MKIAIDIDSTLHDYWKQFREVALAQTGVDLPYEGQTDWHVNELERAQLAEVVRTTHDEAMVLAAVPYPGAVETVNGWHAEGHFVHITSHRADACHPYTTRWPDAIGLRYDELYCSYDKIARCVELGVEVLIDDSPVNLRRAQERGIRAATLLHPWNRRQCAEHDYVSAEDWIGLGAVLAPILRG